MNREKKRKRDLERYYEHADEKRAYQRAYYAANRELLAQRRRERGPLPVKIRTD